MEPVMEQYRTWDLVQNATQGKSVVESIVNTENSASWLQHYCKWKGTPCNQI